MSYHDDGVDQEEEFDLDSMGQFGDQAPDFVSSAADDENDESPDEDLNEDDEDLPADLSY